MAIILNGLVLSDHMIWVEETNSEGRVAQTFKRTLGGNPVIIHQQLFNGLDITLVATAKQGWLTKAQVLSLQAMASISGSVLSLTIGPNTYTVMFRHHEDPALEAEPLDQIGAQAPAGYYTATIKLVTV